MIGSDARLICLTHASKLSCTGCARFSDLPLVRGVMEHCCEVMAYWVGYRCSQHPDPIDCPDGILFFSSTRRTYGIRVHDGGAFFIAIEFCPWCGSRLESHGPRAS